MPGVKDMILDRQRNRMFVSTLALENQKCLVVKVFEYQFDPVTGKFGSWSQIFSTDSKLPNRDNSLGCPPFSSLSLVEVGGALALEQTGALYFSIGDFGTNSSGSIYRYANQSVSRYATGSRNAEGLFFDQKSGRLFESEHGPKGGDEINILKEGDDLGWPYSSYGIAYNQDGRSHYKQPSGLSYMTMGSHPTGKKPAFVYMPAIGPTSVLLGDKSISQFKDWDGSLLVASLRGNSIYRVYIDGDRGMYSEPIIDLKERIRFMRQGPDGSIYAKGDPDLFFIIQLDWPGVRRLDPRAVQRSLQSFV